MPKSAPGPIDSNGAQVARTVTAADTPPFIDSNCDPTTALITNGWRSVKVFPRFTGGTAPTVSIQVLHRMLSVAGNGWVAGPTWTGLLDGEAIELDVNGRDVFFAVTALTGSPTSVAIYVAGWSAVNQKAGAAR